MKNIVQNWRRYLSRKLLYCKNTKILYHTTFLHKMPSFRTLLNKIPLSVQNIGYHGELKAIIY